VKIFGTKMAKRIGLHEVHSYGEIRGLSCEAVIHGVVRLFCGIVLLFMISCLMPFTFLLTCVNYIFLDFPQKLGMF